MLFEHRGEANAHVASFFVFGGEFFETAGAVPEPSTAPLLGIGLALAASRRRKNPRG